MALFDVNDLLFGPGMQHAVKTHQAEWPAFNFRLQWLCQMHTGSLGALVNHECGRHPHCRANAEIQRDGNEYWVTSIKDISTSDYIAMDYNFDPSEMDLDTDDQRWWREYYCLMCQPSRAGAFHMGVSGINGGSMGVEHRARYEVFFFLSGALF